eukprot:GHVN01051796.1.p1 GENE.GHVN01051796.1~~GHVN01051796.1.p1  ORF type:complete len:279 (+),score=14.51 GHVN01051796.1:722-1558(+)
MTAHLWSLRSLRLAVKRTSILDSFPQDALKQKTFLNGMHLLRNSEVPLSFAAVEKSFITRIPVHPSSVTSPARFSTSADHTGTNSQNLEEPSSNKDVSSETTPKLGAMEVGSISIQSAPASAPLLSTDAFQITDTGTTVESGAPPESKSCADKGLAKKPKIERTTDQAILEYAATFLWPDDVRHRLRIVGSAVCLIAAKITTIQGPILLSKLVDSLTQTGAVAQSGGFGSALSDGLAQTLATLLGIGAGATISPQAATAFGEGTSRANFRDFDLFGSL